MGADPLLCPVIELLHHFLGLGVRDWVFQKEPEMNPITFISCTNEDAAVEWMKDAEEVCPYCSESDDFVDEANEDNLKALRMLRKAQRRVTELGQRSYWLDGHINNLL